MHTEMILRYLDTYNEREIFYQTYQNKKRNPEKFAEFIASLDPAMIREKHLIVPELPEASAYGGAFSADDPCLSLETYKSVLLEKHDRFSPAFLHTHNFFEIIYVLRGHCTNHVYGKDETLNEGDLCFLSPNMAHSLYADGDSLILNIILRQDNIEDIFYNVLNDGSQIADFMINSLYTKNYATYLLFHTKGDRELCGQILEMYMEQQFCSDVYSDRIITSMLIIFFSRLMRRYDCMGYIPPASEQNPEAAPFLAYILKDYRTITLTDLARRMNYSVPYCSRHIKDLTGHTFLQLLQQVRFQKAEHLLRTSTLSIQKISSDLGYENPENFIRAFKKAYGISPARFRVQMGAQNK